MLWLLLWTFSLPVEYSLCSARMDQKIKMTKTKNFIRSEPYSKGKNEQENV